MLDGKNFFFVLSTFLTENLGSRLRLVLPFRVGVWYSMKLQALGLKIQNYLSKRDKPEDLVIHNNVLRGSRALTKQRKSRPSQN